MDRRRKKARQAFSILMAALLCSALPASAGAVEEPAGYRMENYRAPVPETLKGARVVTTQEAEALWRQKTAIFIDVMPDAPKPANLPKGTIWKDKERRDIPGSIWLANVGYGEINAETAAYFKAGIEAQIGSDKKRPILFYCMTDCWMSWNAAKRAVEWGFGGVLWYPPGSDGWEKTGLPLEKSRPWEAKK
ncbi:PQQ-dependent catabolism-associated CXXCW motif protein [Mesorhizobium sp. LHD-90]|uniref:PQQ-dependent catabolism-associated CXXCW motif protein n=1 Tax=Mesorhizobium sp. LHD-90 TaxID=3071414 RepID=UPI0027E03FAE|nr:PQQ-dependent catabolism-associated CXXCW motif protein [Mesorhizobium sp. LHD-90]MDQ6435381.1 PQQ-dependent catabolism-associated CXXCW motif protein [Mesorhizobium sp. LHD-90]